MQSNDLDDLYARTNPALLAMHACERAAVEYEAAMSGETERWFFAITDMHQALTAALVETLAMRQLFDMTPLRLHLEEDEIGRAERAIDATANRWAAQE